eukprot:638733-Amphidinium_carterae.1
MESQQLHDEPNAELHEHGPVRYRLRGTHRYVIMIQLLGISYERATLNLRGMENLLKIFS